MAEEKKCVSGNLIIADAVIVELAGYAALESYGVVGMAAPNMQDGFAKLLPMRRLQRGILLNFDENDVATVELHVIIENGTNLSAVSRNLADRVRYTLENFAQIGVADVLIHVEGIHVKKSE
ncbi:MAG TPA: Asp23/Gls24 family envelope stress response protein [Coriobacteriia bacterium]|nr:Asp23/Gls24 family envelope stress response protein [Coriobacteriia bacterium]